MKIVLLAACFASLAACSPPAQQAGALSAAPLEDTQAKLVAPPTDAWLGKWIGVEGNYLEVGVGAAPGVYALTEGTLDGVKSYVGTGKALTIEFEEAGKNYTIRPGAGTDTGLKYLADKTNCLVIEQSRGFCR
jgi:hypothetical protein